MEPILILTALELEARALARDLRLELWRGSPFPAFRRGAVRLAPVGLGATLCGARWDPLVAGLNHPLVVSAGVCGALDPRLRPGDLVIPTEVTGTPGGPHAIAPGPHRAALARGSAAAWTGALVTTQEVVRTPGAKAALFAASGAVATDMESAAIVARAASRGCSALVVRAVSDSAGQGVTPELARLVTPEGKLDWGRALTLVVARPAILPEAFGLGRRTRRALGAVARALAALIG